MTATDLLEKIGQTLGSTATVKSVFGEPIQASGKTIVPVAKVAYGFGGGSGTGKNLAHTDQEGGGGGGGKGVRAYPAGALEVTPDITRFVPFVDWPRLVGAFAAGLVFGALVVARR
jgi:uncharacterized spore protein YtfJ